MAHTHGSMDPAMDMSSTGGMPMPMGGGMMMWLHFSASEYGVLFQNWNLLTPAKYGGFCFALIVVCILKEFLFAWRTYRLRPAVSTVSISDPFLGEPMSRSSGAAGAASGGSQRRVITKQTLFNRLVGSLLYAINLFLGYMIMLVIMTYNWGFIFCILFGSAFGHLAFSWLLAPEHSEHVEAECCEK